MVSPLVSTAFAIIFAFVAAVNDTSPGTETRAGVVCKPTRYVPLKWQEIRNPGSHWQDPIITNGCAKDEATGRYWAMLRAYRSRSPNFYWRYTDDIDDPECLDFWNYYDKSGTKLIGRVLRTTKQGDLFSRRWCPLTLSQKLGEEGQMWVYCDCTAT